MICISMATLLAGAAGAKVNAADRADGQPGWDREKAAQYLDDRMDLWFAKATKLETGEGKTSCISCHSAVPYLLARPALRKAMGVSRPTAQEEKLLDELAQRVDTFDSNRPLYEHQAKQARGTEAVLNLLILAGADAREHRQQPSELARKALHQLFEEQRPDGAWDWLDTTLEPDESADARYGGAARAAFALGSVPGLLAAGPADAHITKLCAYLDGNYASQNLYNRAWLLLASTRLKNLLSQEQRAGLIAELKGRQHEDGGWSLYELGPWRWSKSTAPSAPVGNAKPSVLAKPDGYATGLLAYVLREAGLPAGGAGLKRATDWLKANQQECQIDQHRWKCWRSHSLNYDREAGGAHGEPFNRMLMSDLATAFAVLALSPPD